jgi:hypothetical protein
MENIEYSEWVPTGVLVKGLSTIAGLFIIIVSFAIFIYSKALLVEDILGVLLAWVVLGIMMLVLWNYRGLQIKISDKSLFVDYGRFDKKSFLLKDISSCKKPNRLADT